jgi:hypothetical protein
MWPGLKKTYIDESVA